MQNNVMKRRWLAFFLLLVMLLGMIPISSVEAATYKKGSSGNQVRNLQRNLKFLGYSVGSIDGKFGNNTKKAVVKLQGDLFLEETGVVDEELDALITGTVKDIQQYLKEKGYYAGAVDGIVGNGTTNALKNFQKAEKYAIQTGNVNSVLLWDIANDKNIKAELDDLNYWVMRSRNGGCTYKTAEYLELFREYPLYLTNETMDKALGNYVTVANEVVKKNESGTVFGAVLTALSEGKDIIWNQIASLGGKAVKTYKEEMRLDAIMCLMQDVCKNTNLITVAADEVGEKLERLESGYNWLDKDDRKALCEDVSNIFGGLSVGEVEKIVTLVANDETVEDAFKGVNFGIQVAEYAVGMIQLYQIELATLQRLQDLLPEECDMYQDLEALIEERTRDEVSYINQNLFSTVVKEALLDKMDNYLLPFPANVIMTGAELSIDIFANHIYTGALSEEQIQTYFLNSYVNTLKLVLLDYRTEFVTASAKQEKLPTMEQIEDYEFVSTAYFAAVKNYLISAGKMADKYDAQLIGNGLEAYDELFTYENYIKLCLQTMKEYKENSAKTATEKMDYLLEQLGADTGKPVYFTVNQKACSKLRISGHGCTNCNVGDIVKQQWFTDLFGNVNVDNFPKHDVNANVRDNAGQSCFGFACFAQWYIYQTDVNQKVTATRVKTGTFTKDFVKENVLPGDVLRIKDKDGGHHSVLVYAVKDDHIVVLDSNWSVDDKENSRLNCTVQKHKFYYKNSWYSDRTVYVNRVKGVDSSTTGNENTDLNADEKLQYGYYHYTNGEGGYSVCAHYGKTKSGWKNVYYEEIWVDEPLKLTSTSATSYRHIEVSGCENAGCFDDFWSAGGKYEDENGVIWYRQKTKAVSKDAKETQSITVISETAPMPTVSPTPTASPMPTVSPTPVPVVSLAPVPSTAPVVSDWVKASECPAGAEIVDTKWTYTYTERTENQAASLDGWIKNGERKEVVASGSFEYAAFPDTFDKTSDIYKNMYTSKDAIPVTEGAEREILSDTMAGYIYWHYSYPVGDKSVGNRIIGYYNNQHLKKEVGNWCYTTAFTAFKSATDYSAKTANNKAGGGTIYKITDADHMSYDVAKGSYWWYRFAYNTCTYQDVKTVYQYYKTYDKESTTTVTEGNGNSNVVQWVKYKK